MRIKKWLTKGLLLFTLCCLISGTQSAFAQSDSVFLPKHQKISRVLYGRASYYSNKFHGRKTASGEIFNQQKMTCACNALPFGTWIKVTNVKNGRWIVVKVNDRLHPKMKRLVDLTRAGAQKLGYLSTGLTRVKVEVMGRNPHPTKNKSNKKK